jgi:HD-GYP domain-containing protein (c-di-GMP phosphodiesterase class II)
MLVADAFAAITSGRPYRPARSPAEARDELLAGAGTQFDPACVAALLALLDGASSSTLLEATRPAIVHGAGAPANYT